jgi:nucleoside-diphosphate kinase
MVWQGKNAVALSRQTIGATSPVDATAGSIRGDLAVDIARNIVHGSDSPASAHREINLFFTAQELLPDWPICTNNWTWE